MNQKSSKVISIFFALLLIFSIGYKVYRLVTKPSVREMLEMVCNELNQDAPFNFNKNTVITDVKLGEGRTLIYSCELIGLNLEGVELTEDKLKLIKKILKKNLDGFYYNREDLKIFRKDKVKIIFRYFTTDKKFIAEVSAG